MIKALIKKQFAELFYTMFARSLAAKSKKGQSGKGMKAVYIGLLLYVVAAMAFMFYAYSEMLFTAFLPVGLGWLGFALIGTLAMAVGVLTTVFLAGAVIYKAKDNDMLLAMPIKPWQLVFARVFTLYIMDACVDAVVILPCFAVYAIKQGFSLTLMVSALVMVAVLPIMSMAISCALAFLIALVTRGRKQSSMVTIVLSVAFLLAYFYVVTEINTYITAIITNGDIIAEKIKLFAYPVYMMGLACTGNMLNLLLYTLLSAVIFGSIYVLINETFLKLATMNRGEKKTVYREKALRTGSVGKALFAKEFSRLWNSSIYFLNGAMGSILMIIASVFLVIKGGEIKAMLSAVPELSGSTALIVAMACFAMSSMGYITPSSVSLEGKSLWILRSLPISPRAIFKAKVRLHMAVICIPAMIFAVACIAALGVDMLNAALILAITFLANLAFAMLGVAINLKFPDFNWTNEAVPVKQGMAMLFYMLSGMAISVFFVGGYLALTLGLGVVMPAWVFLACVLLLISAACVLLYLWLGKKGAEIFETF